MIDFATVLSKLQGKRPNIKAIVASWINEAGDSYTASYGKTEDIKKLQSQINGGE